jgi:hypothetical protein
MKSKPRSTKIRVKDDLKNESKREGTSISTGSLFYPSNNVTSELLFH